MRNAPAIVAALWGVTAGAQAPVSTASRLRATQLTGVEAGVLDLGGGSLPWIGIRTSQMGERSWPLGWEIGVGTPLEPVFFLDADALVVHAFDSRTALVLRGGGSAALFTAGALMLGWNLGAGFVVQVSPSAAVRVDFFYRRLTYGNDPFGLRTATAGVAFFP